MFEDDEALRKVAAIALSGASYTLLTAACGDEALQIGAQHAGDIHLLLTDVVMPRMSGKALAKELTRSRPSLKVLYMSGYIYSAIVHKGVVEDGVHFMAKPFTAAELTWKVRQVLHGDVSDLAEGYEQVVKAAAKTKKVSVSSDAIQSLPQDVLGNLLCAVITARYDEIVEHVETIRKPYPVVANELRQMADDFDYEGMRQLLSR